MLFSFRTLHSISYYLFLDKKLVFLVLVSWISFCISSVNSIHLFYGIIGKNLPEDEKILFLKACLPYFKKNVSYYFSRRIIHREISLLFWKVNLIDLLQITCRYTTISILGLRLNLLKLLEDLLCFVHV